MTERKDLNNAIQLLSAGNRKEATTELLKIYNHTRDKCIKLQTIFSLNTALERIQNIKKLIEICDEGITIAHELSTNDNRACLMAQKAIYLMDEISLLQYKKNNLKLTPGWFEYAIESDKSEFIAMANIIENYNKEADKLFKEALEIAMSINDTNVKGQIMMKKGESYMQRYLYYKLEFIVQNPKVKWARHYIIKLLRIDKYLVYNRKQRKIMKDCLSSCVENYIQAAKLFVDDISTAYAFYNLSNHLRAPYMFRKASKYLSKSERIANKYNDNILQNKITEMKKRLKNRNRDIPKYHKGETMDPE